MTPTLPSPFQGEEDKRTGGRAQQQLYKSLSTDDIVIP
jgi:hypothetical protein